MICFLCVADKEKKRADYGEISEAQIEDATDLWAKEKSEDEVK